MTKSLMSSVNHDVNNSHAELLVLEQNVNTIIDGGTDTPAVITEAITNWLAMLVQSVKGQKLDPTKKRDAASVLGAADALSKMDIAQAFNTNGDLGTTLALARQDKYPEQSRAALTKLMQIGRHESLQSYANKAVQALDNPEQLEAMVARIQPKIDQVMRKLTQAERKNAEKSGNQNQNRNQNRNQGRPSLGIKGAMQQSA